MYVYAKDRMLRASRGAGAQKTPGDTRRHWVPRNRGGVAAPLRNVRIPAVHSGAPSAPGAKRQALPGADGRPRSRGPKPPKPSLLRIAGARDDDKHHLWRWMRNDEAEVCVRNRICVCCFNPITEQHTPGKLNCGFSYAAPNLPVPRAKLGLGAGR